MGLAKLGGVIRFIPESVILGFTAGIAIVIFVGQWGNFFGLPASEGATLFEKLPALIASFSHVQLTTTLLGVASLLIVALWPRIPFASIVPSPMVALVAATVFVTVAHPDGVATIGSAFGGIPRGLPPLTLPHASISDVVGLLQPALAVALLGAIESLLSATVADGMIGTRHDPNQELVGQGIANLGVGLLGGFAATGAIARTATSIRHGGTSPVAGIAHAATILLVLVVFAPLAYNVPLTTLAAILFVVAFNMSQIGRVVRIARRSPRSDVSVMLITLVLCVFADISVAVEVGVILALLNFFRRMTATVEVRPLAGSELAIQLTEEQAENVPEGVLIFTVDGPFFFGAVEEFESALVHTDTVPDAIVLNLANVPFIDLTGLIALEDAIEALEKRGVTVALCCAPPELAATLTRSGVTGNASVGAEATLAEAIEALTSGPSQAATPTA